MVFCRQLVDEEKIEGTANDTLSPLFLIPLYPFRPCWEILVMLYAKKAAQ